MSEYKNQAPKQEASARIVGYRGKDPEGGEGFVGAKWPDAFGEECVVDALVTLSDYMLKDAEIERLWAHLADAQALLAKYHTNPRVCAFASSEIEAFLSATAQPAEVKS